MLLSNVTTQFVSILLSKPYNNNYYGRYQKMTDSAIYRPERLEFVVKTFPKVCDNVVTTAVLPWGGGKVRDDLGLEAI